MKRKKSIAERKQIKAAETTKMRIRKGDVVEVIAGEDKGTIGKVLSVIPTRNRVVVERVNFIKRHTKPRRQGQQGGIIEKEAPIHVSNVLLHDPKANKGARVGLERRSDGTVERISKKSGDPIGGS